MQIDVSKVIEQLGGPTAAARLLNVRAPSVIEWRRRNAIPIERCAAIEKASCGQYRRWHMRPADWHLIWPELVGSAGAPGVPTPSAEAVAAQGDARAAA